MGNAQSTRWKGHTKKTTVETCRRITAREAWHIGAPTISAQVAGTSARRLWCLCPDCEARALYLYQLPTGGAWKCQQCHRLTNQATQQHGTRAAFEQWLTPKRWAWMSARHPALKSFYDEIVADFRKTVAPLDPAKISAERRAELLQFYANDAAIKRAFEDARWHWSARMEEQNAEVSAQVRADIWRWWKHLNRSQKRPKS